MVASARIVSRLGLDRTLAIGAAGCCVSGALMEGFALAGFDTVPAIAGPMFLFMASFSLTLPQGMAGAISPFPQMAGAASSIMGFFQFCFSSGVAIAVGFLADGTQIPMTTTIFVMGTGSLAVYLVMIRPRRQPATPSTR